MTSSTTALQSKANPQQLEAILATDGPVLIIAGPGSGKTFTLVERIVYLITHKGVAPESLLVVTFTDKAARELTTRVSNRLAELGIQFNLNEMYLGTFHSICLRLLEDYREFTRLKRSFTLFDQFDQQYFLYQHIKDFRELPDAQLVMGDDQTGRWAQSENLLKWLNKVSEEALDAATLAAAPEPEIRALATCFAKYQELLHEHNSLDFSGIQYEALQLLEKRPEVLAQLRERLTYLMVDEYQDTNTIQERILLLLAGERSNLCVVGDDDQGLYRFRGATIRNILEFPALFDDGQCKQVKLTVNYRSHPDIIRFYNEWMREQTWDDGTRIFRFAKQIVPRGDDFPDLPTAVRLAASDDKDDTTNWHAEVLAFLNGLKSSGRLSDWNQVAFLFRSVKNDKVVALARFLEAQGVPVFSPRSNMFFEREEIRLMIGALIFLFPQFPKVRAWAEGVTLPIWDYYDHQCFKPFIDELRKPENKPLLDWARPLAKRHAVLAQNTDYAFSGLFYQLLQFPLFSRFLTEEAVQGVDKGRAARNLGTFSKLLTKFEYLHFVSVLNPEWLEKNLRDLFNQFLRFLHDGGIGEYEDEAEYAPKGCVSFLTIHQSKGLEFPVVVCGSLEAVPRKQYGALDVLLEDGDYLAKERFEPLDHIKNFDFWRLFYTAFSRAQNLLVLAAQEKQGRGRSPSGDALAFAEKIDQAMRSDQREGQEGRETRLADQLRKGVEATEVLDHIFGLEYLSPRYSLTYGGQDIGQLSPGERGLLLLVFYLLVDKDDIPIVIDQPEENLDNQTIYKILVKCIKKAKERRQVIMVTHNPNLAVVCDAEQIIYAFRNSEGVRFEYEAGAIEQPEIKNRVVQILEGTEPAFKNRQSKYRLQ